MRGRRALVPLDAEATATRTEADGLPPPLPSPLAAVPSEPVPVQLQRTPERQRLADAIETVRALEVDHAEATTELSKADDAFYAASRALTEAEAQLARAKPVEGVASAYGTPVRSFWGSQEEADRVAAIAALPPVSIAEARALVATAQDAVDSAQRLRQHWRGRGDKVVQDLEWRRMSIAGDVRNVLPSDPAIHALAAECRRLATASAAANRAFNIATGGDTIQSDSPFYGCTSPTNERDDVEGWSLAYRWRVALDALRTDPDAPLPMPA